MKILEKDLKKYKGKEIYIVSVDSKMCQQSYYNLEEKWQCKGISDNEFNLVRKVFIEYGI
jgi:hypothetical protein